VLLEGTVAHLLLLLAETNPRQSLYFLIVPIFFPLQLSHPLYQPVILADQRVDLSFHVCELFLIVILALTVLKVVGELVVLLLEKIFFLNFEVQLLLECVYFLEIQLILGLFVIHLFL